ncbi:uncharacterized protein LOC112555186 [Pomacea canaliculata]|uniref:uncharacterized protein LOC112555186 n=1 Tax=Pomacea canaliculata TaxID=400727 RepID=UPI000D7346AA|nr:uncharacterized protein LOC112555186 [Pomacea canaliculata]
MAAVMLVTLSVLFVVVENEVIERTSTGHIYERAGDNTTAKMCYRIISLFPPNLRNHIDDTYTDKYSSEEKIRFENNVTHTDQPAAVNTSDDQVEGFHSVHWDFNLQDCDKSWQTYRVRGNTGTIQIVYSPVTDSQLHSTFLSCNFELEVPPRMVAHVLVIKRLKLISLLVSRYSMRKTDLYLVKKSFFSQMNLSHTRVSSGLSWISVTDMLFNLCLNFTAVPEVSRPKLVIHFISTTKGCIETSQLSENIEWVPFVNTWTDLVAPEDHVILINIQALYKNKECFLESKLFSVIFHTEVNFTEYKICELLKNTYTEPLIYHEGVRVQYKSFATFDRPFFRIQFSFHHVSALPVQLSEGRWNCSAVRWEDMQHHFPCNFVSNCVGGEDEAGCWSGDGTCSPGTLQAGGRCFSLSRTEQQVVSWNLANNWCQQRGSRLPSLTTRHVWDAVVDLCHKIDKLHVFYVGARSAPPTIPAMYQNSWIWSDGTIAHFIKFKTFMKSVLKPRHLH